MKKMISVLMSFLVFMSLSGQVNFKRSVKTNRVQITPRKSPLDRTYVFPRSQLKYGHFQNYTNWWMDRPLYMERSLRYPTGKFAHIVKKDYINNTVPIVQKYECDGLANISVSPGKLNMYKLTTRWQKEENTKNHYIIPEIVGFKKCSKAYYALLSETVKTLISSPHSFLINGKPVLSSYGGQGFGTPEYMKEIISRLRKEHGDFIFIIDVTATINGFTHQLRKQKKTAKQVSKAALNKIQAQLDKWLNAADGIMYATVNHAASLDKRYAQRFQLDYFRDLFVPMLVKLVNQPKYKGKKLLALPAAIGYTNFLSGSTRGEANTRRLRETFETSINVRPDFIHLSEWNEVNENTSIQPTVANSWTAQRIMKYFIRKAKGQKPLPNKGDDLSIPNLVFSSPKTVKYGEVIDVELLNIPDSESSAKYTVQLTLKDIDGKTVQQFPNETFTVKTMRDVTYDIDSTSLDSYSVLVPELKIVNTKGKEMTFSNLHYIRLTPSYRWDYQAVKQPLRDLYTPERISFTVQKNGDKVDVKAKISGNEKLASVEVIEDEREVYAYDRLREFDLKRDFIVRMEITAARPTLQIRGDIVVDGTSKVYARPMEWCDSNFNHYGLKGNRIRLGQGANNLRRGFIISFPRADIETTILKCKLNNIKFEVPAKLLAEKRIFAKSLNKTQGYVNFIRQDRQVDIPVRINKNKVEFSCETIPEFKYAVYSLRAITDSNKIYRSKPFMVAKPNNGKRIAYNVWNEAMDKVTQVRVAKDRIPDLTFDLNPKQGDAFECKWSPFWFGQLGGSTKYGDSFGRTGYYPKNNTKFAPDKVKLADGSIALKFDGKGTYATVTRESLPRGEFTLSFDVKPESEAKKMILFRHQGWFIGSLSMRIDNGVLTAGFARRGGVKLFKKFNTGLKVSLNEWSKIKVMYDYNRITFVVNEQKKSFSFKERALYFNPIVFGGFNRHEFGAPRGTSFFNGMIKNIRIQHYTEK